MNPRDIEIKPFAPLVMKGEYKGFTFNPSFIN